MVNPSLYQQGAVYSSGVTQCYESCAILWPTSETSESYSGAMTSLVHSCQCYVTTNQHSAWRNQVYMLSKHIWNVPLIWWLGLGLSSYFRDECLRNLIVKHLTIQWSLRQQCRCGKRRAFQITTLSNFTQIT